MSNKVKMSNRKFRCITLPIAAFLLIIAIVLIIAANIFAPYMDYRFGRGQSHIVGGGTDLSAEYYTAKYDTPEEAKEASYAVAEKVTDEGMILLKNDGVLPLEAKAEVAPFGYRFISPTYGQGGDWGSAKPVVDPVMPEQVLNEHFTVNTQTVDAMKRASAPQGLAEAPGTLSATASGGLGGNSLLYEYDPNIYGTATSGLQDATAIVFLGRSGGEDLDFKYDGYTDGTPHYLALTQNERETIRLAKQSCKNVVVVIMSSSVMELAPLMTGDLEVDAIVWAGHTSERGLNSLGSILVGDVNPSGRTVDIFPTDFTKDPTYQNIGEFYYSNSTLPNNTPTPFIEYEEGIYLGYRYYETADSEDEGFVYGTLDGQGAIETAGAVTYPFGYGLSYTQFSQAMTAVADSETLQVEVEVTNIGEVAGKEVVQLYVTAPYTQYDADNHIEKSAVALLDYAKTDLLAPEGSETVTIDIDVEDLACYDSSHRNSDGTQGCYMLEAGDYIISLRKNSHDVIDSFTYTVEETIYYDNINPRSSEKEMQAKLDDAGNPLDEPANGESFVAATNLFQDMTDYMLTEATVLSRSDWSGTFPSMPDGRQKAVSAEVDATFGIENFDVENDPDLGNVPGSKVYSDTAPVSGADNGLTVSMMRGKDYYDPDWDLLLDQIDWGKKTAITDALFAANYLTGTIDSIGLPATAHADGANGIKDPQDLTLTASYGYAPIMAATWNVELLAEVGEAIAQEALINGYFGWYAPAFNLHRSPFCGRIFEYYSEDPIVSGKTATAIVAAAGQNGFQCYLKHFVLNDMETNRANFVHTWVTEQAFREMYLKPFEMVIRDARMTVKYYNEDGEMVERVMRAANALMASQNDVGSAIAYGNYNLITGLVRTEWGFTGTITTDMHYPDPSYYKGVQDLALRAGCDTYLTSINQLVDKRSNTSMTLLREAIHHVAYAVANSNVMQGVAPGNNLVYDTSPWVYWGSAIIAAFALAGVALIVWNVQRTVEEKKHPERYKNSKRDKNNG